MATAEEALKSNDPKVVKRLRGSISTQLTCDINLLEKELAKKKDGKYDLDQINHQLMKMEKKKLHTHLDLIEKLHDRYLAIREEGLDDDEEQLLKAGDIQYREGTSTSKIIRIRSRDVWNWWKMQLQSEK